MFNCKSSKTAISFQFFCNVLCVTCSHMPFECIHYSLTLFIFEYVHKRILDPPLVISPPLCKRSFPVTLLTVHSTDYGHPERVFFENPKLLGLGRQIGLKMLGAWAFGVFSAELSVPILGLCVPCPCFPLINHYIYKNISF